MQPGDPFWVLLWVSVGADAFLYVYFHRRARRNALWIMGTMGGVFPVVATWAWAIPFYLIMAVTFLHPSWLSWAAIGMPGWAGVCGAIGVMLTPFFGWWVLHSLGNNFTEAFAAVFRQKLVTRGPYRHIRHPLYAVECIFLSGFVLATANWIILGFGLSAILVIRLVVIPQEEGFLLERFGELYKRYRKRTGVFHPPLRSLIGRSPAR